MRTSRFFWQTTPSAPSPWVEAAPSGRPFSVTALALLRLRLQDGAQALDVACHHGKGDVALETGDAVIPTASSPCTFRALLADSTALWRQRSRL
jgi:hypothetical protein